MHGSSGEGASQGLLSVCSGLTLEGRSWGRLGQGLPELSGWQSQAVGNWNRGIDLSHRRDVMGWLEV